jgi:hypothetical protein
LVSSMQRENERSSFVSLSRLEHAELKFTLFPIGSRP